jgi:trimeric autotransporter adhesin
MEVPLQPVPAGGCPRRLKSDFLSIFRRGPSLRSFLWFPAGAWLAAFGLLAAATTGRAVYNNQPVETFWVADGLAVQCVLADEKVIYLGGSFTMVGPSSGHGAMVHGDTGQLRADNPKPNDKVYTVAPDGGGGWFIGGTFTRVGGLDCRGVAHIRADGTMNPDFHPQVHGEVRALARSNGRLYVGGNFLAVDGQDRRHLAAVDEATGDLLPWDPRANDIVHALAATGSRIFIGGAFTQLGGQPRNHAAAADGDGTVTGWDPDANAALHALAVSPDGATVYFGGWFTELGGEAQPYLAAADATTGGRLAWNPEPNSRVFALAVSADGTTVFAGGAFGSMGGAARNGVAAVDAATGAEVWTTYEWPDNQVEALALSEDGSRVYIGGVFGKVGAATRRWLAAVDATTGALLPWDPAPGNYVRAVAAAGDWVYAGGSFTSMNSVCRRGLAAMDRHTGEALPWDPAGARGTTVLALEWGPDRQTIYAGGYFAELGGETRSFLAELDRTTGQATPWNPGAPGGVRALRLAPDQATVYVGGWFTEIGGQPWTGLAEVSTLTGLATDWDLSIDSTMVILDLQLSPDGNTLFVGGAFSEIAGQPRSNLAALDLIGRTVGAWRPDPNRGVFGMALAPDGQSIFIGGVFDTVSGVARGHLAELDTQTGAASSWNPGVSGYVYQLALKEGRLYLAGEFSSVTDIFRNNAAAVYTDTGELTPWNPNLGAWHGSGHGYFVVPEDVGLLLGGQFSTVGGDSRNGFAYFPTDATADITVTADPAHGGTVAGAGTYRIGSSQRISAAANSGWSFAGWSDANQQNPRTIIVPAAGAAYTANFTPTSQMWNAGYQDLGGGWQRLTWFGDYVPLDQGWYWHNCHGFFYVWPDGTPQNIYLYTMDMGWLFTSSATYPYLYRFQDASWLWYVRDSKNPRWFFNFCIGVWEPR